MQIPEKFVCSYQKIYERKYDEKLSAKDAERDLSDLAELLKLIRKD